MKLAGLDVQLSNSNETRWGVFDGWQDDEHYHVMPMFGPPHFGVPACWCHPECDPSEPMVLVHNVAQ